MSSPAEKTPITSHRALQFAFTFTAFAFFSSLLLVSGAWRLSAIFCAASIFFSLIAIATDPRRPLIWIAAILNILLAAMIGAVSLNWPP